MNLEQANVVSQLSLPSPIKSLKDTLTAAQVAYRILARCEAGGYPYKHFPVDKKGAKAWAKKFLTSSEFKLMRVNLNAAASPHKPRDPKRVKIYAAGDAKKYDPIVIDVNRRQEGRTHLGYVPDVIVVDGKHRKAGMMAQGLTHHWAWVGVKAAKKMKPKDIKPIADVLAPRSDKSPIATAYELFASTVPAIHPGSKATVRQDTGAGGARPTDHLHLAKTKKVEAGKVDDCNACGARSTGSLDPSEKEDVNVSDLDKKHTWNPNKPNLFAPGTGPGYTNSFGSPNFQAPGAGSGPRVTNKGASRSELARKSVEAKSVAADVHIDKMYQKKKKVKANKGGK